MARITVTADDGTVTSVFDDSGREAPIGDDGTTERATLHDEIALAVTTARALDARNARGSKSSQCMAEDAADDRA
jgi:hypothetical protein